MINNLTDFISSRNFRVLIHASLAVATVFAFAFPFVNIARADFFPPTIAGVSAVLSGDQSSLTIGANGTGGCDDSINPSTYCAREEYVDLSLNLDVQRIINNASAGNQWSGDVYWAQDTAQWRFGNITSPVPAQVNPSGLTHVVDTSNWPSGTYRFCATIAGSVTPLWPDDAYEQSALCSQTFTITSAPTPDFSCTVVTNNATLDPGGTTTFNVQTQPVNGFNSVVSYTASVSPSPAGAPTVSPISFSQTSPYATTATTVSTNPNTPQGPYVVTYTGVSGGTTHTCSAQLVVNPSNQDFNILITPAPTPPANGIGGNTNPNRSNIGTDVRFQVFIECFNFNGPVSNLTAQTTFTGVNLSLGATSLPCGGTTILTVSNTASVPSNQQSTITNINSESIIVRGSGQL